MTTMRNVKDGSVLLNHNRAASGLKVGGAMFNLNQLAHAAGIGLPGRSSAVFSFGAVDL